MVCRTLPLLGEESIMMMQTTSESKERLPWTVQYRLQLGGNTEKMCPIL